MRTGALADGLRPDYPKDPCIPPPISTVVHDDKCRFEEEGIDIAVRPIVYTNDLPFDLLMALLTENAATGESEVNREPKAAINMACMEGVLERRASPGS